MFASLATLLRNARLCRRDAQLTRSEFAAVKLARFREFVRFVNASSPYYAGIIQARQINVDTCVPEDFPVLSKHDLMEHWDDIVTDRTISKQDIADFLTRSHDPGERFRDHYTVIHTSGSSGEVGYFIFSPQDLLTGMGMGRPRPRTPQAVPRRKRPRGRIRVAFYGATDGHYAGVTMASLMSRGFIRLLVKAGIFEVNSPLPDTVKALNAFQPDMLMGYTTALKMLAEKQLGGELDIAPAYIGASGEVTTPEDQRYLQEVFKASVSNAYGCSEHLVMGASMPGDSNLVVYDNHLILECREDHVLVSNLFNHTLPLIRYRMSDTLHPVDTDEHAPYLVIESLVGRNEIQPRFVNRNGEPDFISPHTINEVFVSGVNRFQMHLLSENAFRFMVVLDVRLSAQEQAQCCENVRRRLREILARKRMDNVVFEVVSTDTLPVNPKTRKFQLIVEAKP